MRLTDEALEAKRQYEREYRKRNRDKLVSKQREYYHANKEKYKQYQANYWARKAQDVANN